ncbi:hypothetical protein, partial [Pseudomonas corrugata]|uniref:hypothetical protein n=1 Tax=Pseudomonas corrugata TaxID=47879 RepID=UPI0019D6C226
RLAPTGAEWWTAEHFLLSDVIAAIASASLLPQFSVIARQALAFHVIDLVPSVSASPLGVG